jgi:hypothetical protein
VLLTFQKCLLPPFVGLKCVGLVSFFEYTVVCLERTMGRECRLVQMMSHDVH